MCAWVQCAGCACAPGPPPHSLALLGDAMTASLRFPHTLAPHSLTLLRNLITASLRYPRYPPNPSPH